MRRRMAWLFCALSALALSAVAGCGDKFREVESNDIGLTYNGENELLLAPNSDGNYEARLSFDRPLSAGRKSVRSLRIRQVGSRSLSVFRVYLEGAEDCDHLLQEAGPLGLPGELEDSCKWRIESGPKYATPEDPLILEDGAYQDYDLVYKNRTGEDPGVGRLVIESNTDGKRRVDVVMALTEGTAIPTVNPPEVVFEAIGGTIGVSIANSGNAPLVVDDARLVQTSEIPVDPNTMEALEEFFIVEQPELPWRIMEQNSVFLQIQYQPRNEGTDEATLTFYGPGDNGEQAELKRVPIRVSE